MNADPTDLDLDALLVALDKLAKQHSPRYGLPVWGEMHQRELLRLVVRQWLVSQSAEAQR